MEDSKYCPHCHRISFGDDINCDCMSEEKVAERIAVQIEEEIEDEKYREFVRRGKSPKPDKQEELGGEEN